MKNTALIRQLNYLSKHTWNNFRFEDDDVEYLDGEDHPSWPQPLHSHRLSTEVIE